MADIICKLAAKHDALREAPFYASAGNCYFDGGESWREFEITAEFSKIPSGTILCLERNGQSPVAYHALTLFGVTYIPGNYKGR